MASAAITDDDLGNRGSDLALRLGLRTQFSRSLLDLGRRSELLARKTGNPYRSVHPVAAAVRHSSQADPDRRAGTVVGLGLPGRDLGGACHCLRVYFRWVETATLVPAIACLTWTFGSWPLLRRVWPAIIFLVFLLPLPSAVNDFIALPLQRIAATGSCFLLQLSGFWAIQEGNVIQLATPHGPMPLDVALACNGLRMLMTMAATITATIILIPLPTWKRITLLFSTVPIAMISNIIRIVATGWCYYMITGPTAKEWAHDASGWLMMPLALLLVWLELQLLSWLVPEKTAADVDDQKRVIPLINEQALRIKPSGKDKQKNTDLDELPKLEPDPKTKAAKPKPKPKNDDQKVILPRSMTRRRPRKSSRTRISASCPSARIWLDVR